MLRRIRSHHGFMTAFGRTLLRGLIGPVAVFLLSATVTLILVFAFLFRWLEHDANPAVEGLFDALYLTIATMTTVGYGDVVPVTTAGRAVAMVAMLAGVSLYAGYTALVASAIVEAGELERERRRRRGVR